MTTNPTSQTVAEPVSEAGAATVEQMVLFRLVEHLTSEVLDGEDCEVATQGGAGRCIEEAVAIRWESGFADKVCETHAETAADRGAVVAYGRRHDGTDR
jgi:hypothetical protein